MLNGGAQFKKHWYSQIRSDKICTEIRFITPKQCFFLFFLRKVKTGYIVWPMFVIAVISTCCLNSSIHLDSGMMSVTKLSNNIEKNILLQHTFCYYIRRWFARTADNGWLFQTYIVNEQTIKIIIFSLNFIPIASDLYVIGIIINFKQTIK